MSDKLVRDQLSKATLQAPIDRARENAEQKPACHNTDFASTHLLERSVTSSASSPSFLSPSFGVGGSDAASATSPLSDVMMLVEELAEEW